MECVAWPVLVKLLSTTNPPDRVIHDPGRSLRIHRWNQKEMLTLLPSSYLVINNTLVVLLFMLSCHTTVGKQDAHFFTSVSLLLEIWHVKYTQMTTLNAKYYSNFDWRLDQEGLYKWEESQETLTVLQTIVGNNIYKDFMNWFTNYPDNRLDNILTCQVCTVCRFYDIICIVLATDQN